MIAKYKGLYFCVDTTVNPAELWRYDVVDGFQKCIDDGLIYYSKFVDISEIEEILDVGFSVKWNGHWCGANPSKAGTTVGLLLGWGDGTFAREHGFYEIERDRGMVVAWGLDINIDTCEEFRVKIWKKHPYKEEKEELLSQKNWLELYQKTVNELSPHGYKDKT